MSVRKTFSVGYCEDCGKAIYPDRKTARARARLYKSAEQGRTTPYRCPSNDQFWHLGHLPRGVTEGRITRGEIYTKPRRSQA